MLNKLKKTAMSEPFVKSMKRAQQELRSLYSDGWVFLHQVQLGNTVYIRLHHPRNNSRMTIEVCPKAIYWHKGGRLRKAEFYD